MIPVQRAGVKMLDVKNLIRDLNDLYDYGEVKFDSSLTYLMDINFIKKLKIDTLLQINGLILGAK